MSIHKIFAFIKKDFAMETSYRFAFILRIVGIFTSVLTFYFISNIFGKGASVYLAEYGGEYFPFVLIGIAFSGYLSVSLHSISSTIRGEQVMGTLESILATPTKVSTIIVGSSIWDFFFATFNIFIYLLLGAIFFNVDFRAMNLISTFIILALTIMSFSSIGIISAAFILVFKKGDPITWFISVIFSLLGGVYYPVKVLPKFLQECAYFLPITHSLNGLRLSLLKGHGFMALFPDIKVLFIYACVFFPISVAFFKIALKKAKRDGTLVHY
jgi:ABC-2 type transport system permease protein